MSTSRLSNARWAWESWVRTCLPIVTTSRTIRSSAGGSWPVSGISLAMFTH